MQRFHSLKNVLNKEHAINLNKVNCPLEQKFSTTNIVYKAKVTSSN